MTIFTEASENNPKTFLYFEYILEGYTVACRKKDADNRMIPMKNQETGDDIKC